MTSVGDGSVAELIPRFILGVLVLTVLMVVTNSLMQEE